MQYFMIQIRRTVTATASTTMANEKMTMVNARMLSTSFTDSTVMMSAHTMAVSVNVAKYRTATSLAANTRSRRCMSGRVPQTSAHVHGVFSADGIGQSQVRVVISVRSKWLWVQRLRGLQCAVQSLLVASSLFFPRNYLMPVKTFIASILRIFTNTYWYKCIGTAHDISTAPA